MKLSMSRQVWRVLGLDNYSKYALDAAKLEIEDGKGTLIATNGRVIVALPVQVEEGDEPGLIPSEALGDDFDPEGVEDFRVRKLRVANGRATIEREGGSDTFPEWKAVIPAPDSPAAVEFIISSSLLHDMACAMDAVDTGLKLRIPLPVDGAVRTPIRVDGPHGAVGSIMPMLSEPQ